MGPRRYRAGDFHLAVTAGLRAEGLTVGADSNLYRWRAARGNVKSDIVPGGGNS
jgi:hypothetical protein